MPSLSNEAAFSESDVFNYTTYYSKSIGYFAKGQKKTILVREKDVYEILMKLRLIHIALCVFYLQNDIYSLSKNTSTTELKKTLAKWLIRLGQ